MNEYKYRELVNSYVQDFRIRSYRELSEAQQRKLTAAYLRDRLCAEGRIEALLEAVPMRYLGVLLISLLDVNVKDKKHSLLTQQLEKLVTTSTMDYFEEAIEEDFEDCLNDCISDEKDRLSSHLNRIIDWEDPLILDFEKIYNPHYKGVPLDPVSTGEH